MPRRVEAVAVQEDAPLFRPIYRTAKGLYVVLILASIVAWGFFAWIHQLINGLGVTGMGRPVYWGVYITNFIFFIGISRAGTLVSAILRVTQAGWHRPITRAGGDHRLCPHDRAPQHHH